MRYVVKQIDDPSIDKIHYGIYFGQDLILLLDEKNHAYKLCEKWNTKKIMIKK